MIMMCRSRMVPVKANFRSAHTSVGCRGCGNNDIEESQHHLLRCPRLNYNSVTQIVKKDMRISSLKMQKKLQTFQDESVPKIIDYKHF